MGIPSISSLMNMEYMLYGGNPGVNPNCPSYVNGYRTGVGMNNTNYYNTGLGYYTPSFRGGYNQDIFTASNDATRVDRQNVERQADNPQIDWSNPQFRGLTDDLNEIGQYYIKSSAPSESFFDAVKGGVTFGLINNPRLILHPVNSIKTTLFSDINKAFVDVTKEGTALNKLWTNKYILDGTEFAGALKGQEFKGGYELVSEAYSRMHKLESLANGKLGWFRRSLKKVPDGMNEYKRIKEGLTAALKTGNPKEIAMWTEEAKRLTNRFTGFIPKGLRAIGLQEQLTWLRKKINPSHYEEIGGVVEKNISESTAKSTLGKSLTRSCGIGNGVFFAAMEFLNDLFLEKKIQKAFDKDSATGWTQVGQTTIKGVGSAVGWAVGEGIGAWAGGIAAMKIGAAMGTTFAPGVGTVVGAVAGLVGGMVGSWLMGKVTHAFIGDDVGTKAEVEKMKKTAQGQVQLLQLTAQQAEGDKKINQRTLQAMNNIANFYGAS